MTGGSQPRYDPVAATSRYLVYLLSNKPYRQVWEQVTGRRDQSARPGKLQQDAVRLVYVKHLAGVDDGLKPAEREQFRSEGYLKGDDRKRVRKDQVNRALNGKSLDLDLLNQFIDAFGIELKDAERLRMILRGDAAEPIAIGTLRRPAGLEPAGHETLTLNEVHHLGRYGLPIAHVSEQRIRALRDGLTHFPYRFDTDNIRVSVMYGGTAGELVQVTDGVWEVPIRFAEPLRYGDEKSFKFSSRFDYDSAPWTDFRRAVSGRLDRLTIRVKFHRQHLPARVWWTEWEHYRDGSPVVWEEQVPLQDELMVDRFLNYVESAVVGFRWEW
ncbi:hypothetical protein [Lentzea sp. NPDC092896]|uniref:hypothetical protein n=1 Tax=Lentzea sp. NPDC092896 TaxID=3364127 RepID=UPI0037F2F1CB